MKKKLDVKVKKIMSQTFNCKLSELNNKTSIHQLKQWDSISHYLLISNLEKEFKIKFNQKELVNFNSLESILKILIKKINDKNKKY